MTDEQLIEFKNQSMQDGKLNLSWFADYVAQAEREACVELIPPQYYELREKIRARGQA